MRAVRKTEILSPMDLAYMKRIRLLLHYHCSWPHQVFGEETKQIPLRSNTALIITWIYFIIADILYIKRNTGVLPFFDLGQTYITFFMHAVALITTDMFLKEVVYKKFGVDTSKFVNSNLLQHRMTISYTNNYKKLTKRFVNKLHLFHHKHRSAYFKTIDERVERVCRVFTMAIQMQICVCTVMFNLSPILNNYNAGMYSSSRPVNGTFEHAFYYVNPISNIDTDLYRYIFITCINVIIVFDCGSIFCIFDMYLSLIVFHLWGHLKALDHHLKNFPLPRHSKTKLQWLGYTPEESVKITEMLIENINHHKMIKEFMGTLSGAFGSMLYIDYFFHQLVGCIMLLECSRMDASSLLKYGLVTVVTTQQLAQVSVIIESLGSRNEVLADTVYSLPWEHMSLKDRKIVNMFLLNVQAVSGIKAMGMVPIGVQTMAAILKTAVSYFMLLRTFATAD